MRPGVLDALAVIRSAAQFFWMILTFFWLVLLGAGRHLVGSQSVPTSVQPDGTGALMHVLIFQP
jgi:hypothetical protein